MKLSIQHVHLIVGALFIKINFYKYNLNCGILVIFSTCVFLTEIKVYKYVFPLQDFGVFKCNIYYVMTVYNQIKIYIYIFYKNVYEQHYDLSNTSIFLKNQ